jgi:signal transduction histidine kinase
MEFIAPLDGCPDANALTAYLQTSAEKTRAALSRELHDQMGGLLVAAAMDVGFAEQALAKDDRLRQQLSRARTALAAAIELKRKLVESLRPSILDNFGLFEAIRWEVKQQCVCVGFTCVESYPDAEPEFNRDAAISLFRIVQESLGVALRQRSVKSAQVALSIEGDSLRICVLHGSDAPDSTLSPDDVLAICSIAHRAHSLGGRLTVNRLVTGGGTEYRATLPLTRLA